MTSAYPSPRFDYRTAGEDEILERAREMVGRRLRDLVPVAAAESSGHTRGEVGAYVEAWFGIPQNSRQEADFPGAGIELKTVPLTGTGNGETVKERLVLSMIDYEALARETWERATIRHKLDRLLLVFYRWSADTDIGDFPIARVHLWHPDERQLAFMELDWTEVREKVVEGMAHELSEGDTLILGAATKGADARSMRVQPRSPIPAKQRAWSLKQPFMRALHMELRTSGDYESLMETLRIRRAASFESEVLRAYEPNVGRTVGELAGRFGMEPGPKDHVSRVLRKALGQVSTGAWAREFDELGITVKTVLAGTDAMPYEALSFPAFRYRELAAETWDESDLRDRIGRFLFLPMIGEQGLPNAGRAVLRRPFFWSPTADDLAGIEREWTMFRDEVAAGHADRLPTARSTTYLHVRPKARDGRDTDLAPVVGPVVKKAFWLNKAFVQRLLREHGGW